MSAPEEGQDGADGVDWRFLGARLPTGPSATQRAQRDEIFASLNPSQPHAPLVSKLVALQAMAGVIDSPPLLWEATLSSVCERAFSLASREEGDIDRQAFWPLLVYMRRYCELRVLASREDPSDQRCPPIASEWLTTCFDLPVSESLKQLEEEQPPLDSKTETTLPAAEQEGRSVDQGQAEEGQEEGQEERQEEGGVEEGWREKSPPPSQQSPASHDPTAGADSPDENGGGGGEMEVGGEGGEGVSVKDGEGMGVMDGEEGVEVDAGDGTGGEPEGGMRVENQHASAIADLVGPQEVGGGEDHGRGEEDIEGENLQGQAKTGTEKESEQEDGGDGDGEGEGQAKPDIEKESEEEDGGDGDSEGRMEGGSPKDEQASALGDAEQPKGAMPCASAGGREEEEECGVDGHVEGLAMPSNSSNAAEGLPPPGSQKDD
ncbi:MAG: hypothetical protein SGPRY_008482, partial [Prymnesium sp.]